MKECHVCNAKLSSNSKYCNHCGEKVITEQCCSSCNKKMPLTSRFCDECGTKLGSVSQEHSSVIPKNKYGNSLSNLHKTMSGNVTVQGEDIYLADMSDIYKIRGNQIKKIYSGEDGGIELLNVVGDHLYFSNSESIYTVTTSGGSLTTLFTLSRASEYIDGMLYNMIVVGEWIYFSLIESVRPFVGRIRTNGDDFQILYKASGDYENIVIIDASEESLYIKLDGLYEKTLILSTDGKKEEYPHQFYKFTEILNRHPDDETTIEEIKKSFDDSIVRIDFDNKWIFCKSYSSIDRVSFDGQCRELHWQEATHKNWAAQTNNPSTSRPSNYHVTRYFDVLNRVNVGFAYGGPHYYTLFQCLADGSVVCLGGDGDTCEHLQVIGDWVYWSAGARKKRQNMKTYEEQVLDLKGLKISTVQ